MFAKVIAIAYFKNFTFSDLNISHASSSLLLDIPFIGINYSLLLALLLIKNHIRVSDTYASFKLLIHIQLALIVGVIHKKKRTTNRVHKNKDCNVSCSYYSQMSINFTNNNICYNQSTTTSIMQRSLPYHMWL